MLKHFVNKYAIAVQELVRLEAMGTGGSHVAAQLLLSAYNGGEFQVDISELCGTLDEHYFALAMDLIVGRRNTGMEPHQVIENGDRVFKEMWKRREKLHVKNRWKPWCRSCDGMGSVPANGIQDEDEPTYESCPVCNGRGW